MSVINGRWPISCSPNCHGEGCPSPCQKPVSPAAQHGDDHPPPIKSFGCAATSLLLRMRVSGALPALGGRARMKRGASSGRIRAGTSGESWLSQTTIPGAIAMPPLHGSHAMKTPADRPCPSRRRFDPFLGHNALFY